MFHPCGCGSCTRFRSPFDVPAIIEKIRFLPPIRQQPFQFRTALRVPGSGERRNVNSAHRDSAAADMNQFRVLLVLAGWAAPDAWNRRPAIGAPASAHQAIPTPPDAAPT